MRPIERIKPFLEKVDIFMLLDSTWSIFDSESALGYSKIINTELPRIRYVWEKSPDLRFSQVLVNLRIIPNIPGFWYYMEEPKILVEQGVDPAECYYWGINYDKDMNELPKTIYKPIKELSTDHLRAILDGGFVCYNALYKEIMENELKSRGE